MSNGPNSRDRRSLQDLAKLASSPTLSPNSTRTPAPPSVRPASVGPASVGPAKSEHDSGIVDLKQIATADSAAAERAKTTPLASAPLFDDENDMPSVAPPPMSTPPASAKVPTSSPPRPRGAAQAAAAAAPAPKKSGLLVPVLAGLGIAALAAVAFLATRPSKEEAPQTMTPAALTAPTAQPTQTAAAKPAPEKEAPPPTAAAAAPAPADPTPEPASATPADTKGPASGGRRVAAVPGTTKKGPDTPGGSAVSGLSAAMAQAANVPSTAPVQDSKLNEQMQRAVGASGAPAAVAADTTPAAPQFAPGSVPEKPSQGAVTSALSRALPSARTCLKADDPVSKANVTFTSGGSVSAVVVTGSAAGKPAEDCIRSALMKASLPPFAQATYSANVTVRPN